MLGDMSVYIKAPINVSLLFFGLSCILGVFQVLQVFPVNLGTEKKMIISPGVLR